jgi:ADP-heptose:LPS heptosyltransferase
LLAIHPDAGTAAKRWPVEFFAQAIDQLTSAGRWDVKLIGLNRLLGDEIVARTRHPIANLMGRTSLAEMIETLADCDGLLTNDSGPAHVMAALGKPVWVLWSGTAPSAAWRPRGGSVELFERPVPCAPCGQSVCPIPGHPCMERIAPQAVVQKLFDWSERYAHRA